MVAPMLRIPAGAGGDATPTVDVDALVAAAPAVLPAAPPAPLPVHSFVSPHLTPLRLSRYESPELGVGVSTSNPNAGTAEILADALTFNLKFNAGPQVEHIIAVAAMALGLALVVAGVRLFRPLLFALSWMFIGGFTYFVSMLICGDSLKSFISGIVIGLVGALVALKVWRVSLGLVGALGGFVVWLVFQSLFPGVFSTDLSRFVALSLVVVAAAFLAVKAQKPALLICTPLLGAFLLLQGFDHFAAAGLSAFKLLTPEGKRACEGRGACFGLYAALLALTIAGVVVQWKWTANFGAPGALSSPRVKSNTANGKAAPEMIVLASPSNKRGSGNPFATAKSPPSAASKYGNPFLNANRRSAYAPTAEFYEG